MASMTFSAGAVTLPSPTSLTVSDEIIWSSDTGRALDGTMWGEVIAQKKNISIKWEYLTEAEMLTIKNNLISGFFSFTFPDNGTSTTITGYRGTLSKELLGRLGDGVTYYKSVSVDIIQK